MKFEIKKISSKLVLLEQPVITLETQEEINVLYSIFNYIPIINVLDLDKEPWNSLYNKLDTLKNNDSMVFREKLNEHLEVVKTVDSKKREK